MIKKRILIVIIEIFTVFAFVWLIIQLPELTPKKEFGQQIKQPYREVYLWQDLTLFVFSLGTSMLFWKRQRWGKQDKARYFCLYAGMFSVFSLLIILTTIRTNTLNFFILGLFVFFITSLLITSTIHYVTLQTKHLWIEFLKIIFLGLIVFGINIFSIDLISRPSHGGESGLSLLFVARLFGLLAFITSIIINFALLKKAQWRKI